MGYRATELEREVKKMWRKVENVQWTSSVGISMRKIQFGGARDRKTGLETAE